MRVKDVPVCHLYRLGLVQHFLKLLVIFVIGVSTRQPCRPGHEVGRKFSDRRTSTLFTQTQE